MGGRGRACSGDRDGHRHELSALACAARDHGRRLQCGPFFRSLSVASLVGFGAVVAALPAFGMVRDWVLSIEGGPLVSLAVATNVLASLTGSASGGLTIALDALGGTYMRIPTDQGIDPALMHRVAVIGAGTLDSLPHNGAVVTLLAVCDSTHGESYLDIVMVADRGRHPRTYRGDWIGDGFRLLLGGCACIFRDLVNSDAPAKPGSR